MELTAGQKKGLEIACKRYNTNEPYTVIAGYAGTGKSTLVSFIVSSLNIRPYDVGYIAYTGKAALVLKNKGCKNAMTAHKMLYNSTELPDGTFQHTPKEKLSKPYKLIVCDEASMLPQEMISLLLSHGVHVLFLGDNAQLPPIDGKQTILDAPHVFLDEITRQAYNNPIIQMSMNVRNNQALSLGGSKRCRVIEKNKVSDRLLLGADQILVGKNKTRHQLNNYVRHIKWGDAYSDLPLDGDKVICLKNYWNIVDSNSNALVNGQIGVLQNIRIENMPPYGTVIKADVITDSGDVFKNLLLDCDLLEKGVPTVNSSNWILYVNAPRLLEFAYGYAITVHKAQGSEFDRVLVYDEWLGNREEHKKWLYTAITRASEQLVIAK